MEVSVGDMGSRGIRAGLGWVFAKLGIRLLLSWRASAGICAWT